MAIPRPVHIHAALLVFLLSEGVVLGVAKGTYAKPSNNDGRRPQELAAKKACSTGDVGKGIDILADLYVQTNDPVYVHNQGRCYQQNAQPDKAISRFEEYLRKVSDLPESERSTIENYIRECQAKLQKTVPTRESEAMPEASRVAVAPPSLAVENVETHPRAPQPLPSLAAREQSGSGLRTWGIVGAALGSAGVGAGLVYNLLERNLHNQMANDLSKNTSTNESRRSSYQISSVIGYAAGAMVLVTGIVTYVVGSQSAESTQESVAVAPVFGNGSVSLALSRTF